MRLSLGVLFALLSTLLSGNALAAGGLSISGGSGNVTISGMLAVSNPTSPGLSVSGRNSGAVNLNGATTLNTGAQHAVSLATNNVAHTTNFNGTLDIDTTTGTGFLASSGGTFVATGAGNSVTATSGPAISLTSTNIGGAGAAFGTVNSTNSPTRGILLDTVTGSLITTGGSITGAVGIPVEVNAGTVSLTYAGGITQSANNPMVQVTGGHNTGTLTFQTGTLNATMGTGLQFNNADGTYGFNGTTTLNGGDAGVDITNGSSGTFNFGTNAAITNPSGTAFNINGSNCAGTYSGSITDNSGFAIDVDNHDSGTYTFQTGTLTSTGTGVRVANSNGGTIDFAFPTKTLNTATNTAVTLNTNNAGGTVNFSGGGLDIDTTTATAFSATGGGTVNVTGVNNTIDTTTGRPVDIQSTNAGGSGITFARAISTGGGQVANIVTSTGTKALGRVSTSSGATTALNLNGAGTVNIGDAALASSLTTTTAPTVTINNSTLGFSGLGVGLNTTGGGSGVSVTGGTVAISGNGMVIDTDDATDGPGFVATSGGTVTVQGTAHTVTSGNQTAVNIANTTIGANGVSLQSVSCNGASSGIVLNNTGASGGFTVTGTGGPNSGGTITNTSSVGATFSLASNISLNWMLISNTGSHGISGSSLSDPNSGDSVPTFALRNSRLTSPGDADNESALYFGGAGAPANNTGRILIADSVIEEFIEFGLTAVNTSGTLTVEVTGTLSGTNPNFDSTMKFDDNDDTFGQAAIFVSGTQSAMVNVDVQGVFTNDVEGGSVHVVVGGNGGSSSADVNIIGCAFDNAGGPDDFPNNSYVTLHSSDQDNMTFDVQGNYMLNAREGIVVVGDGIVSGRIGGSLVSQGNTISDVAFDAIRLDMDGGVGDVINSSNFTWTVLVQNNTLAGPAGNTNTDDGIQILNRDHIGTLNLTIENNSIANFSSEAIRYFGAERLTPAQGNPTGVVRLANNSLNNTAFGVGETDVIFRTTDQSVLSADVTGNTHTGGAYTIDFDESETSDQRVEQTSLANLSTLNGAATATNSVGSLTFNVAANPTLPTHP